MFRLPRTFSKMEISLCSIDSNRWCFEGNEENEEKSLGIELCRRNRRSLKKERILKSWLCRTLINMFAPSLLSMVNVTTQQCSI